MSYGKNYESCSFRLHDMLENVKIVTTRPGLPYCSQLWQAETSFIQPQVKLKMGNFGPRHCLTKCALESKPKLLILVPFFSGEVTSYTDTSYCIHILWDVCRSVFLATLYIYCFFRRAAMPFVHGLQIPTWIDRLESQWSLLPW